MQSVPRDEALNVIQVFSRRSDTKIVRLYLQHTRLKSVRRQSLGDTIREVSATLMSTSLIVTARLASPGPNAAHCFSCPTFRATDEAGGSPAADMNGSEPSSAVESLDDSILSGPSSRFDSQSQAGSATKIVSEACARAYINASTQFPQKERFI
jgi:hypothetical protein